MEKRQRNYRLFIQSESGPIVEITLPFTVEFDIRRSILSSANTSTFRVHNLSELTRLRIHKDRFSYDDYRSIEFKGGYQDTIPTIFKGNIKQCWSVRQGTSQITTAEAFDGGFALVNGKVSTQYPKGTPVNTIIDDIVGTMPNVQRGAIGSFQGSIQRGNTIEGNSAEVIQQLSNGALFIDNERVYVLNNDECIRGGIDVISADSGLLNSPVKEETVVNFDILFEPRLMIGQLVELRSVTQPQFNGFYKVVSLHHRGTISDAISGSATTSVGLWYGPNILRVVN